METRKKKAVFSAGVSVTLPFEMSLDTRLAEPAANCRHNPRRADGSLGTARPRV
ncbi:hypothetical protein HMPREF9413_2011 [Paenibacillus sp. HGF7]|nr:hypothetical protein HMPREF9413_2011 [Paenibacillus sp. HGF7]